MPEYVSIEVGYIIEREQTNEITSPSLNNNHCRQEVLLLDITWPDNGDPLSSKKSPYTGEHTNEHYISETSVGILVHKCMIGMTFLVIDDSQWGNIWTVSYPSAIFTPDHISSILNV